MGVRKGQGYGVPKPKRCHCPECGKKGVTQWEPSPASGLLMRYCQYCQASWGEAGWAVAKKTTPQPTLSADRIDAEWREWNLPGTDSAVAFLCLSHRQQVRQAFEDGLRRGAALGVKEDGNG